MSTHWDCLEALDIPAEYADAKRSSRLKFYEGWHTLIMCGNAGIGKTRNAWAIFRSLHPNGLRGEFKERWRCYIVSECMGIDANRYDQEYLKALCCFPGVLVVDDIGYKTPNEWNKQAVYAISTERRKYGFKTIWTTNITQEAIKSQYSDAIQSRLFGDIVLKAGGSDRRTQRTKEQN